MSVKLFEDLRMVLTPAETNKNLIINIHEKTFYSFITLLFCHFWWLRSGQLDAMENFWKWT